MCRSEVGQDWWPIYGAGGTDKLMSGPLWSGAREWEVIGMNR